MCRTLPAEEVEQQLAWRSGDAGGGFPAPCPDGLSGPRPLELKTCAAQPPREEPASAADVAPQSLVHGRLVRSGTTTVGSADVLVVDEELIEARELAHPSDAEKAWRGPDRSVAVSPVKSLSASARLRRSARRPHAPGRTSPGPAR